MTTDPNALTAMFILVGAPLVCVIAVLIAKFGGESREDAIERQCSAKESKWQ